MARSKRSAHDPAERLARAMRQATLTVYCATNRYHDAPGWEEVLLAGQANWVAVARELMRLGVQPPPETNQ